MKAMRWRVDLLRPIRDLLSRMSPGTYALEYGVLRSDDGQEVAIVRAPPDFGGVWMAAYRPSDSDPAEVARGLVEAGVPMFALVQEVSTGGVRSVVFIALSEDLEPPLVGRALGLEPISDPDEVLGVLGVPQEGMAEI